MQGEVGHEFAMIPSVGEKFSINKSSTTPVLIQCDDDITMVNGSQTQITNLWGFFSGSNTVPAELDFSGRNSVGAQTPYAKILSRIDGY